MRKILVIGSITLLFLLAACSGDNGGQEKAKSDSYSVEQVIAKADAAFESLKSLSVDLAITQYIEEDGTGMKGNLFSEIHTDMMTAPAAFHQTSHTENSISGLSHMSEAYYTKEGMFLNDGSEAGWIKVSPEQSARAVAASMQMNPAEELHKAEGLHAILSMVENSEEYVVTLKAAGDKHREDLKKFITASMPAEYQRNTSLLENLDIKDFNYELVVNRRSFFPSRFSAKAEIELFIAGSSVTMEQEMKGNYSNFNKIRDISVPESIRQLAGD
ncbi:DUF6612 family protein [Neobacillus sp. YIM B06451]|uniref:DUF6612 family protein n=1 Tax=Neobacillus sp. YIM B06451 TaxID=3070994 RepID=UPI002931BB91|nr:DUF6612 family protein [Neobacillus sp. YIM B06451]